MLGPSENIKRRWMFLASCLIREVDSRDRVVRQWLRDEYAREFQHKLRPKRSDGPVMGEHARGDFQTYMSDQRRTRYATSANKKPSDLMGHDLAQFEKAGVVTRDGGWVRVSDWIALGAVAAGDFTSLLSRQRTDRSSSGEQSPPPSPPDSCR